MLILQKTTCYFHLSDTLIFFTASDNIRCLKWFEMCETIPKLTHDCDQAQLKVFLLFYKHMKNRIKSDRLEAKNQALTKFSYFLDKIKYAAAKTTTILCAWKSNSFDNY